MLRAEVAAYVASRFRYAAVQLGSGIDLLVGCWMQTSIASMNVVVYSRALVIAPA